MANITLDLGDTRLIIEKGKEHDLLRNQLAYVLATAYWETARTMKPVKEAYWLSEDWRKKNLRYYPWYGRGYVQLTWEANYRKAQDKTGYPFHKNPDTALKSEPAAVVLVRGSKEGWFTGKKLSDFITLEQSDFVNARRIINGTDRAKEIAEIAKEYDSLLKAEGYGVTSNPSTKPASSSLWQSIITIILYIFDKLFRRAA